MNKESKIRIGFCDIHEEVNTFATESMGFATVTGNMSYVNADIVTLTVGDELSGELAQFAAADVSATNDEDNDDDGDVD